MNRYRDLQQLFAVKNLSTEDVERLLWWSKGGKVGYQGYGTDHIPIEYAHEYMDGINFGAELRQSEINGGH